VENALSSGFSLEQRAAILAQAVAENERALKLANVRYRVGSGDLRAVQQQQLAVYGARTALLRVQSEQLVQRVNLHLALGGGFAEPSER
jgi:outer membrane protein TolC